MTTIIEILAVPATGAYYHEDLSALQDGPIPLAERYAAPATTAGFDVVREVAQAVSVGLVLDGLASLSTRPSTFPEPVEGHIERPIEGRAVVWGDCVSVAYSGKAGRTTAFRTQAGLDTVRNVIAPTLQGRELTSFRELAAEVDALRETVTVTRPLPRPEPDHEPQPSLSRRALLTAPFRAFQETATEQQEVPTERVTVERPLHPAVRYGVSQALLAAVALARGVTMAEVIAEEWGLPRPDASIPIHAQSGSERYINADKMIVRRVASLPHALVDDIPKQLGKDGIKLTRYVRWLSSRIAALGGADYRPTIHLDLHGALGQIFEGNLGRVLGTLSALEMAADPYLLRVESPVIMVSREAQIQAMKTLREYVRFRKMRTALVADEWANTLEDIRTFVDAGAADMIQVKMPDLGGVQNSVEAVLACKAGNVGAFLGGSCAETDLSARVSVHVALATRPDIIMARPGMGVDEAISITQNEMARTLAWIRARGNAPRAD